MTLARGNGMFNITTETLDVTENTSIGTTLNSNNSIPDGCIEVRFDEMEYIPWDNPDNIVSGEVENIIRRIKDNILAVLFLIGVPANIINVAIFYKQGIKDRVNLCLFALSLADGLFLLRAIVVRVELLYLQFTSKEKYGPVMIFMVNNNFTVLFGFQWVSQILSAIIASERCFCIINPIKFQTLLQTRTMAIIIVTAFILVIGVQFLVVFRYRIGCVYDPLSGTSFMEHVIGEFYQKHRELINYLESFLFGFGIPGATIVVVIITTIITIVKLRQIMTWRASSSSSISAQEVALIKMLIGNSLLFIACIAPTCLYRVVSLFLPDFNVGGRYHNFFMTIVWILQITSDMNSTFNFCVYYAMGSRYRETFWSLFSRKRTLENKNKP